MNAIQIDEEMQNMIDILEKQDIKPLDLSAITSGRINKMKIDDYRTYIKLRSKCRKQLGEGLTGLELFTLEEMYDIENNPGKYRREKLSDSIFYTHF